MKNILSCVWHNEPMIFVMPLIYVATIGIVLYYALPTTINEWLGFSLAAFFFFVVMVIAPIFGTYTKYNQGG